MRANVFDYWTVSVFYSWLIVHRHITYWHNMHCFPKLLLNILYFNIAYVYYCVINCVYYCVINCKLTCAIRVLKKIKLSLYDLPANLLLYKIPLTAPQLTGKANALNWVKSPASLSSSSSSFHSSSWTSLDPSVSTLDTESNRHQWSNAVLQADLQMHNKKYNKRLDIHVHVCLCVLTGSRGFERADRKLNVLILWKENICEETVTLLCILLSYTTTKYSKMKWETQYLLIIVSFCAWRLSMILQTKGGTNWLSPTG